MSTPAAASGSKKVTLRSSDDELFEVEESVAMKSLAIKNMIEDDCTDNAIPLTNVTGKILSKVIDYCKFHVDAASAAVSSEADDSLTSDEDIKAYDDKFVKVDQDTLIDLILAANYLNIESLMDLTCQAAADMMKGMTLDEVRKMFNVTNDYTPEEEYKLRQGNHWAFQ